MNEAEALAAQDGAAGKTIDIVTPTGGESVTEGTILEWAVKVGDQVSDGDTVVEISTDKVDMELPAPASGTITEILAAEGDTVTVGQVIARMTAGRIGAHATARPRRSPPRRAAPASVRRPPTTAACFAGRASGRGRQGIDLSHVTGSARGGRITKSDVLAAAGNGAGRIRRRPTRS